MTLRFERVIAVGPVVNYHLKETWTHEVQQLYKKLEDGDCTALAPLLVIDIEFITDPRAIQALVLLKYDPDYPAARARVELRKIAGVIQRRRGRREGKLPPGDLLLATINSLAAWIETHGLLKLRKDAKALERRISQLQAKAKTLDEALVPGLIEAARAGERHVKASRSWAKQALCDYYGVKIKMLDKRIARDPIARAMRAQPGRRRTKKPR